VVLFCIFTLAFGIALVAASEDLLPGVRFRSAIKHHTQLWGGRLTILGLCVAGFGMPLFR
jgi:hypothetical protein